MVLFPVKPFLLLGNNILIYDCALKNYIINVGLILNYIKYVFKNLESINA